MKSDIELLHFIIEQMEQLAKRVNVHTKESFIEDDVMYDACVLKVMVIGEYASKVSKEFKAAHPEVEWALIKAARNIYAHDYGDLTPVRVWKTITEEVPALEKIFKTILKEQA